jgi:hypothetical protein
VTIECSTCGTKFQEPVFDRAVLRSDEHCFRTGHVVEVYEGGRPEYVAVPEFHQTEEMKVRMRADVKEGEWE